MKVLGIDEAGRGCVLGAMAIGAFLVDDPDDAALRKAGARDSKTITHAKRVVARERLEKLGTGEVVLVPPAELDAESLNVLEERVIVGLVRKYRPDRVYLDALGPPASFPKILARLAAETDLPASSWVMEAKADKTYAVVGAASIFAKTERDARLADLVRDHGDLGSGYPSDPATRAWLAAWAGTRKPWPDFVRTKWETVRALSQPSMFNPG